MHSRHTSLGCSSVQRKPRAIPPIFATSFLTIFSKGKDFLFFSHNCNNWDATNKKQLSGPQETDVPKLHMFRAHPCWGKLPPTEPSNWIFCLIPSPAKLRAKLILIFSRNVAEIVAVGLQEQVLFQQTEEQALPLPPLALLRPQSGGAPWPLTPILLCSLKHQFSVI